MIRATARVVGTDGRVRPVTMRYESEAEMCGVRNHRGHKCVLPKSQRHVLHATYAHLNAPQWRV